MKKTEGKNKDTQEEKAFRAFMISMELLDYIDNPIAQKIVSLTTERCDLLNDSEVHQMYEGMLTARHRKN